MQVFLPDFLARDLGLVRNISNYNPQDSIYIPKSNSFKSQKIKQITKISQSKGFKSQNSKSLPTKHSEINELSLQENCNQKYYTHRLQLFKNNDCKFIKPRKSLDSKLHSCFRRNKICVNLEIKEQNIKVKSNQSIPYFFIAKSLNYQKTPKKTSLSNYKKDNERKPYRYTLRKLQTKQQQLLSYNQYRPWSPSKNQIIAQHFK